jgi:ABC-2 type transport system permease protein
MSATASSSDRHAYLLVARREFVERARDRSFRISTGVTMAFLIGFVLAASFTGGTTRYDVGVVGTQTAADVRVAGATAEALGLDFTIAIHRYADAGAAGAAVRDGAVDAALVDGDIVVKSTGPKELTAALQVSLQQASVRRALAAAGLTQEQIARALAQRAPAVRSLEPVEGGNDQAATVAFVGVLALYGQLFAYGYWVASGVVEEKASRIIEVLLATLRPSQLLRGKILGIGALGLCQLIAIVAVAIGVALSTGLLKFPGGAAVAAVYVVIWFLLGFTFYASLFAVAGAVVSRQEDLQATITPLSLVIVASFIVGVQAVENPTSTLAAIASMVPFSAPLVMPSRLVLGQATLLEGAISAMLTLAGAWFLIPIATRAYSRAVLRTGRVKLREAFRRERVA